MRTLFLGILWVCLAGTALPAMAQSDPELIRDYVAEGLYLSYARVIQNQIEAGHRYNIKNAKLEGIRVIDISESHIYTHNRLTVMVRGFIQDELIIERTGETFEPIDGFPPEFHHLWHLIYGDSGWVLAETEPELSTFEKAALDFYGAQTRQARDASDLGP